MKDYQVLAIMIAISRAAEKIAKVRESQPIDALLENAEYLLFKCKQYYNED